MHDKEITDVEGNLLVIGTPYCTKLTQLVASKK